MLRSATCGLLLLLAGLMHAQITPNNLMSPAQLVQDLLVGDGVQISNVSYNGQMNAIGGQVAIGSFTSNNTVLPLAAGIIMSSGNVMQIAPAQPITSNGSTLSGDPDLMQLSGQNINNASILEFDFIPTGDTVSFRYVFASTEYTNYTCSSFNDAFGFFVSGPGINGPFSNNSKNIAVIPGTNTPITINTVNNGTNADNNGHCANADPNWQANNIYYVNNNPAQDFKFNGFTVTLTARAEVICGETYHIKLAIGNGSDQSLDSGVFLEAGSFTSAGQVFPELTESIGVEGNTIMEGCGPVELVFSRIGDLTEAASVTLSAGGTATPGVDYLPALPPSLYFGPGVEQVSLWLQVPLDDDGPETLVVEILQLIVCAGQELLTSFTFNIDSPPPLTVQSYDISGICGETHLLDPAVEGGMEMYQYAWSTGETTDSIEVSPGVTTTYTLTVSDACSVESQTVQYEVSLPVYAPLAVTMGPPVAVGCLVQGTIEVLQVTGGDNDYHYQWSLDDVDVGFDQPTLQVHASDPPVWYVVTITDGCGSVIQDSVLVSTEQLDPVEVITVPYETVICPGDPTIMEVATATGGTGVYTYEWTTDQGASLATTPTVQVLVVTDHTYTITVTDQCDNVGSTTHTTLLPVYAPFQMELPADMTICAGDEPLLLAEVRGGSGYYDLDWEGLGHTDPWYTASPLEDTEYTVTATDRCGEVLTGDFIIAVEHVQVDIVEVNRGQDDWYLQAATTPYAQTWIWDMGDGTRYRGPEVQHSFYDLEDHWVTLNITTANGCMGVDSVLLRAPAGFFFPNAFTPDGDGHNDVFGPVGQYIEEFEMYVFDRWGRQVFATRSVQDMWDGSLNGTSDRAPTGVYIYKYRVAGHYFEAKEGYGQVTLMQGSVEY